jgi:hypothetical protein
MALPDRTGPGLKAVRTSFGGQVTGASPRLWFPFWSEMVNAPHPPFTRAVARSRALYTRVSCHLAFSNLLGRRCDSGVGPGSRVPNSANSLSSRLGQQHLVSTVAPPGVRVLEAEGGLSLG